MVCVQGSSFRIWADHWRSAGHSLLYIARQPRREASFQKSPRGIALCPYRRKWQSGGWNAFTHVWNWDVEKVRPLGHFTGFTWFPFPLKHNPIRSPMCKRIRWRGDSGFSYSSWSKQCDPTIAILSRMISNFGLWTGCLRSFLHPRVPQACASLKNFLDIRMGNGLSGFPVMGLFMIFLRAIWQISLHDQLSEFFVETARASPRVESVIEVLMYIPPIFR